MRLDKKILRKRCRDSFAVVSFLNLTGLQLDVLEHLNQLDELRWLIASDNALQSDEGITRLKQLWYLDLSNNKIKNINNLSRFLALGTLVLSNNSLKWTDLERLSHAHIMNLSLHGNPQLDSDPYYRIHVIDSLPLVWELDGRLVTVTERLHVKQFFIDTQFTDHPVRHKTCSTFQTTSLRNIGTEGVVSKQCKYIYSKFPMSEKHTKHTDERRLSYLCNMVQEDIKEMLDQANVIGPMNNDFLNGLLKQRHTDVERCNMVLLLLVITLEFRLPTGLIRATLVSARLDMIGNVSTMSLFLLPREHRARVVSVLLNAAKVDRDNNVKNEGGLYPQLFMCLYYTVSQLTWIRQTSRNNMKRVNPISHSSDHMALMASEAVSLIVQNTKFCTYFSTEDGVTDLVASATGSFDILLDIKDKLLDAGTTIGGPDQEVYESINQMILDAIEVRLSKINIKMSDIPIGDRYLSLSDSLPIKPLHSVIWASNYLSNGKQVPRTDPPILRPAREALKPKPVQPNIGEKVLLGPQVVGELTMLMEGDVAMARIDEVPVANGAVVRKLKSSDAHFTFVDMKSLCYGKDIGMWRPIKTAGDKIQQSSDEDGYSIHSTEVKDTVKCKYEPRSARDEVYTAPLIYTPKEKPNNIGVVPSERKGVGNVRPKSSTASQEPAESRRLSVRIVKRVMSADNNFSNSIHSRRNDVAMSEFRQSLMRDNLLKSNATYLSAPATFQSKRAATADEQQKKKRIGSGLSCSSLHQHDNVHYIHGFTPREDSSRSNTVSIFTPVTTERLDTAGRCPDGKHSDASWRENNGPEDKESDHVTGGQDTSPVSTSTPKGDAQTETSKETPGPTEEDCNDNNNDQRQDGEDNKDTSRVDGADEGEMAEGSEVQVVQQSGGGEHDDHRMVVTDDGLRDNCPVCIAVANGSLIRVGHGDNAVVQENQHNPVQVTNAADVNVDSNIDENRPSIISVKQTDSEEKIPFVKDDEVKTTEDTENIEPTIGVVDAPPRTTLSTSGGVRVSAGASPMLRNERPKSAMEAYSYYVIQQPQVFASGTSAKINERSANNGFKSDFQQQREEAWRRTTRHRRQRPLTATIMTSTQLPPPQRPSSPSMQHQEQLSRDQRLRITKTDRWLGGGRDLYWESVRKRPKSGHTPGWKEGLPESMRKRRPMSAYTAMPLTPRQYMTRSVMSTSSGYQHQEFMNYVVTDGSYVRELGGKDGVLIMPQARAIQLSQDLTHSRQLTTPVSEDDHRPLLIEGVPPPSIPNPSKRYSSRYSFMSSYTNLDYVYEDDEAGYEGRPSSQLSLHNDHDLQMYYNSSPRILIPMKDENDRDCLPTLLFNQPAQTYHVDPRNNDEPDTDTDTYKLCSLHREMVFPYYNGSVVYD